MPNLFTGYASRPLSFAVLLIVWISAFIKSTNSADFVIEIRNNSGHDTSQYRFDYYPPYGDPPPNTTIIPRELGNEIKFSNGLPGTRYNFRLHPLSDSYRDYLSWEVSLVTGKYTLKRTLKSKMRVNIMKFRSNLLMKVMA